ncbi:MAG: TRAP transporter small permease [Peptostreptococcaceae bacterium]|nr:TRAP transporter small permease [Peptostreptococcaceae bacterium]
MNRLEKTLFWKGLEKFLKFGLIVCASLVTLITFAAVITRFFNINFHGYEEVLIIFAFWLYMFGAAYGSFEKSHITADIIVATMPECYAKALIAMLRNTLTLILGIIFLYWAFNLFQWTIEMQTKTPVWRIPVTVSQSSLLFGLSVMTFYNSVYLYDEIKAFVLKYIKKIDISDMIAEDMKGGQ